jgi:hypothetical protein
MKVILSRKGFDTASGGVPSPIFPDGKMLSLPIPDRSSNIAYQDIAGNNWAGVGEVVSQLAGIPPTHKAHLDPDLLKGCIPRSEGWRPIFGQVGSAEGHLRKRGIGKGDIFLFFGLFRKVERAGSEWRYVRNSYPIHTLFGWLQVAERVQVSAWPKSDGWAQYHPHFARQPHPTNVVYVSAKHLTLGSKNCTELAGAGTFPHFSPVLQLTAPNSQHPGHWLLPGWFHPNGRSSRLSYHADLARWRKTDRGVFLTSVSRGQEFVLDCSDYPEAIHWIKEVFR